MNSFGITFPDMTPAYGSFSSSATQTLTENVALPFTYDTIDITAKHIYTTDLPSANIYVTNKGVYKVLSSLQCDKTSGGTGDMEMFCAVNGTAVPNSATRIQINQNQETLMAVEWFLELDKNDAVSIVGFSTTTGLRALSIASATPVPAIPSIITTIMRIG